MHGKVRCTKCNLPIEFQDGTWRHLVAVKHSVGLPDDRPYGLGELIRVEKDRSVEIMKASFSNAPKYFSPDAGRTYFVACIYPDVNFVYASNCMTLDRCRKHIRKILSGKINLDSCIKKAKRAMDV